MRAILAAFVLLLSSSLSAVAQNTVHYTATNANVKYLFATAEPVAHVKSGDILDTKRSFRLEMIIVILIAVELLIAGYQTLPH